MYKYTYISNFHQNMESTILDKNSTAKILVAAMPTISVQPKEVVLNILNKTTRSI